MVSRSGIINKVLIIVLFSGYVTYVLPHIGTGSFFANTVIYTSLTVFAYGLAKALADREDRKYLIVASFGLVIPLLYFVFLGGT